MRQTSFEKIAIALRPKLTRLCSSFFNRQKLAYEPADAVQETLLRLWQMRDRLDDYDNPETLALLIAKNLCIDLLKMKGNSHERLDTACGIDARSHPDETVMLHDTQHAVRVALAQLPAGQRHMLIMRSEGMTMAEIAAACGSTPNSVKTTICAARKKILSFIETRRIVQ
ncbi:MAG: sigma-70 family RNA polymerase sigma factor [Bacteroidales bacterium]|jgi:RNA polymerase sigma-70 factor (ECF subfamily)|nr:sigma-70 family RNA polymerase sigma factor [Bacteroidales bacterium]